MRLSLSDPSHPARTKVANMEFLAYTFYLEYELVLANSFVVQDAIRGLKVVTAIGPNGIQNSVQNNVASERYFSSSVS